MDVLGRDFVPRLRRRLGAGAVDTVLRHVPQALLAKETSAL